jgi:hypothetical protein
VPMTGDIDRIEVITPRRRRRWSADGRLRFEEGRHRFSTVTRATPGVGQNLCLVENVDTELSNGACARS